MLKKNVLLLSILSLLVGCEIQPQKFNFGTDTCHFCKMTIVDTQHASQFVTSKGKAYKFDAIECMVNQLKSWDGPEIKLILVSDYLHHGTIIDATQATYLICDAIPSPMGANLSSFKLKEDAQKIRNESGGDLFSWTQIKSEL